MASTIGSDASPFSQMYASTWMLCCAAEMSSAMAGKRSPLRRRRTAFPGRSRAPTDW
jgi:hypothetical protein